MDEITPQLAELERELEDYRQRVEAARHNPWHGGDVLTPEFRRLLSSLAMSPSAGTDRADRRNPWRDASHRAGGSPATSRGNRESPGGGLAPSQGVPEGT